ncbi:MAG: murein biosynthesis integral membrane protein MurJ [Polyangiaceae bacterium]
MGTPPPTQSAALESGTHEQEGKRERSRLLARAGVVGAGTLTSRVLGLVRDMALAALFDRDATDAWWVAFTIPNALRQLLGEGAVSSAVIPVLSEKLAKDGDAGARVFFARMRGVSLLALAVVTVLGVVYARPLAVLFAGGYRTRAGEMDRTVSLTRAIFPYIFFMGTAALGMAALNAKRRFAVAAFAPALLNVALLAAAFTLPRFLGAHGYDAVLALAVGALAGGFLQVAAQWPELRSIGYAGIPAFVLDEDVRKVLRRIVPLTMGVGVYYVDLVLSRRLLSGLGAGAQSYFSWAMRLCDFPQGIFVMALSTAALPSLSTLAAKGAKGELAKTWEHGMRLAMFVAIPASAALLAIGEPIVVMLFQRGEFDARAAHETARALFWQGGAVWTVAAVRQTVPAFYALGDTRTPVIVSAVDLCAFIALALGLRAPMGHVGISVAVAGSSAVQMVLLLAGLKWRLREVRLRAVGRSAVRTLAASLAASWVGLTVARLVASAAGASAGARALPGLAGGIVFAVTFVVAARALRVEELAEIVGALRRLRGSRWAKTAGL